MLPFSQTSVLSKLLDPDANPDLYKFFANQAAQFFAGFKLKDPGNSFKTKCAQLVIVDKNILFGIKCTYGGSIVYENRVRKNALKRMAFFYRR